MVFIWDLIRVEFTPQAAMSSWVNRLRGASNTSTQASATKAQPWTPGQTQTQPQRRHSSNPSIHDPNAPERRLQLHQKGLYERMLPGEAFISAHVNRLQHGFYESSALHESSIENVYFVSVHFVFHPQDHRAHRFKRANIRVSIHGDGHRVEHSKKHSHKASKSSPRILRHAPELMYGAVSPESLQWNFSLSSSLGVSHTPVSASVNPSGGLTSNYKVFDMMSVQGSLRTLPSPLGPEYDIEDGMAVWTLEENLLQRSGLPREFDFVMLVHRPDDVKNVFLTVDVDAVVSGWMGEYPQWYTNLTRYMPTLDATLDFNSDIGQRFLPVHPSRGFNFADLEYPLEEYVAMPGTVYPTNDTKFDGSTPKRNKTFDVNHPQPGAVPQAPSTPTRRQQNPRPSQTSNGRGRPPELVNVRVLLERNSPQSINSPRRHSGSPLDNDPNRRHSIRRRRSRTELKGYDAQHTLRALNALNGGSLKAFE